MARKGLDQATVSERVRAMYNAHPFPNNYSIPPSRSDERFATIFEDFLHVPVRSLRDQLFLDAGCGTGENTWAWRRILHPGVQVVGVDISLVSVQIARAAKAAERGQPSFLVGSLTDIALPDRSADVVFCSGVLHHIPARQQAFDELVRVLKPGGYLVLVLYHLHGRAIHGMRRAVVDLLEPHDIDRRVQLAEKLFGGSMQKLADKEQAPFEGVLYDQFVLQETRHSVGETLSWFRSAGIQYLGTWPPVEWSQFGKALRFSYRFRRERPWLSDALTRVFPGTTQAPDRPPSFLTRSSMQMFWAGEQLQLFSVSGQRSV